MTGGPGGTAYTCTPSFFVNSMLPELQRRLSSTLPQARLVTCAIPDLGLHLALIDPEFPTGPLPQHVMNAVIRDPAYWAFCWGSGIALARFLLDDPSWIAGKTVVDLGSGSGVVAIAAAMAGADHVFACDTDPDARLATAANADLNGASVDVGDTLPESCDMLLMADVLYDRQNLPLLATAQSHATQVLVADSRVTELPDRRYKEVATMDSITYPNLGEFDEFKRAHIFHSHRRISDP